MQSSAGIGMVAQQFGRMAMAPREFIDMTVAKDITVTRPEIVQSKKGTSGTKTDLVTNFFPIQTVKDWDIFQYRVDFVPDIPDTRIRKSILSRERQRIGGNCFDGTMMFTVKPVAQANLEIATKLPNTDEVIQIKIRDIGIMSRTDQRFLQIYNIILNRAMSGLKLTQLGRDYFDSGAKIEIPQHGIELWPGYMTSIRQHESNILLNVDIKYKFLRLDTVRHLFGKCQNDQTRMVNVAVGQIVITDYNNTTYRVDRIDFKQSPKSTFLKNDKPVSYLEYYKSRYGITIQDENQPLLVSKAKAAQIRGGSPEEFFLIPELCRLTGLTDQMREDRYLTRDLSQYTRVDPMGRQKRLMDFSQRMKASEQSQNSFAEFGMALGTQLVHVQGRVLPPQDILFGTGKYLADRADWTGPMQKARCHSARDPLKHWFVLTPARVARETDDFVRRLQQVSAGLGVEFHWPQIVQLQNDRPAEYVRELERVVAQDPQLLMCVVSNDNAERYSAIKKCLSIHRAVLSQVIQQRTVTEQNPSKALSVATKVMIQVNAKLGNAPWKVAIPVSGTMVIGFDVCHDTRDRSRSFAAFIASMDQSRSDKYFSAAAAHRNGEELSNSFGVMTRDAIACYVRTHNELPQRIIVYRDGVGDGQIQFVLDHEVKQLKATMKELYGDQPCKMAFVIVTKRINARFFTPRDNPAPGTVVDDVITLPERYDFFLVSQKVTQGTATPTSYNVVHDTLGLSPDRMQLLTHKFCHLYYNWTGPVRVPNVCQYAHKLSLLVGQYFHEEPSKQFQERLYFL